MLPQTWWTLESSHTVASDLWGCVKCLPSSVVLKQVRSAHPCLIPHVETPAMSKCHRLGVYSNVNNYSTSLQSTPPLRLLKTCYTFVTDRLIQSNIHPGNIHCCCSECPETTFTDNYGLKGKKKLNIS